MESQGLTKHADRADRKGGELREMPHQWMRNCVQDAGSLDIEERVA
jgi:hypothetical protein